MKSFIFILSFILILNIHNSYSQPSGWLPQNSGVSENLLSIHFENSLTGWASGASGKIIKTTNGGIQWVQQSSNLNVNLHSIFFTSNMTGWAAGDGGKLIKTTSSGTTWMQMQSGVTANLNSICFIDALTGLAAGSGGVIIKTVNGGDSWISVPSGINTNINAICLASSSNVWAVGETGKILKSTNAGNSWLINVDLGSTCNLYAVHFPSASTGYVAGSYTAYGQQFVFIYNTVTAGEWWFYQYSGITSILRSLYFINPLKGVAVGDSGKIIGTINGGLNWFQQYSYKTNNLYSINFAGEKNGWIAGSNGLLLNTVNAGFFDTLNTSRKDLGVMPLVKNSSLLKEAKYRIIFRKPDTSYNIIRSLNNGQSFDTLVSHVSLQDTGREVDGMIIRVIRIRSWMPYNNFGIVKDPSLPSDSIQTRLPGWDYLPVQNCYLEGSKYQHSPGRPWQSKSMSMSYPCTGTYTNIGSSYKPDSLKKVKIVFTGLASGQMAYRFLATTAATYTYQDMKQVPFKVYEIDETDATQTPRQLNCAFLEFPDGTPDGKWEPTADSLGGKDILYIFGSNYDSNPNTYYTSRNLLLTVQLDVMYIWSAKLKSQGLTYHVNDEFYIHPYTFTKPEIEPGYPLYYEFVTHTAIGVKNISMEVSKEYSLMQNYPNPFNPTTKIKFSIPPYQGSQGDGLIKLVVYDLLGREIVTLVNEQLKSGTFEVEWNASSFSSGVYFYRIQANSYSETKRMVLIK